MSNNIEIKFCVGELVNGEIFIWTEEESYQEYNTFCEKDRIFSAMGDITEKVLEKYQTRPRFIFSA